ncbi:hypothetical protein AT705_21100 [Pseudoalteromonas rubra]|uniref:Uncharacterized protein n=1 Tax=Pseudoalteromonas rubra TaxID=43658 RepID=A0A0U2XC51_9GAMM|nr:hypothetical protein AT705_21100 [Pseudoalteromonas rubra]
MFIVFFNVLFLLVGLFILGLYLKSPSDYIFGSEVYGFWYSSSSHYWGYIFLVNLLPFLSTLLFFKKKRWLSSFLLLVNFYIVFL